MVLSSRGILNCIVMGEEKTWQGAAASSTLAACSAPTAVGLSMSMAAVDAGLKRENHDRLARAERGLSCEVVSLRFVAAITLRWRRMTPMVRVAIMDRKSASTTMAGMETWWVGGLADDIDVGVATTVLCVGGIAGNQGDELELLIIDAAPASRSSVLCGEADGNDWVTGRCSHG